ncbi:MAG: hypothetical protein IPM52_03985 [Bacteroidetes bacterium]|nr:hypothetical protein [Bacteroidota bacterium]
MAIHRLSKSTYIRSLQCQKSLYLHVKRPFLRDKISAEQLAKFKRGTDVGVLARHLFPGGIDMSPKSPSAYATKRDETLSLVKNHGAEVIYEAVFAHNEVLIMLDILVREGDRWKAIEVKSSRKLSATYYNDAALQYYVLKGNELNISSFQLIHINPEYVFDGELRLDELFVPVEVLPELEQMLPETSGAVELAKQTLGLAKSPDIAPGAHCHHPYPCDFLGHCWKSVPEHNLLQMRSLPLEISSGFFARKQYTPNDIKALPEYALIHPAEAEAFELETLTCTDDAREKIRAIKRLSDQPLYLKILSVQPAVPAIEGTRPYQHIPIALSWSNVAGGHTIFALSAQGLDEAHDAISQLIEGHSLVITDDLEVVEQVLQNSSHADISGPEAKVYGIRQLVGQLPLFHPGFGIDFPFDQIVRALTGLKLTSEHWLKHDLLQANDGDSGRKMLWKLDQYTQAIRQVWASISQLG